ncbi:MAG: hybrid sensor histidine kinase/response regulator [Rhodobacterales bacterium 65-51]|uniref:hybrid sensor histidine kinase/response regulator n=1 Tax=uncultured Gemmobacter sp. TaxID=1095917 RepID=UPI00095F78ED|nr:PAS-domain containing protein [uncultured Gemmobacter sp.]OJY31789.1 MAG: hybrid sensor histidine kinase/response regulator [Rhodobacterales bacterium 65-51]
MPVNDARTGLMRAGLNLIQQALSIYDRDLKLALWNHRFQEMFDLPEQLVTPGASFEDTIFYLVERGEYGPVDDPWTAVQARVEAARAFQPHYMERERPGGRWISVEGAPLPQGGWVTVYTDITEVKLQEKMLRNRSAELSDEVLANAERLAQANRALAATNAALAEAKRELTEMEARTRLTTEMMPAHIAHVDCDLHYTYSNRRLGSVMPGRSAEIIGLTGREALGDLTFGKILPYLNRALAGEASVFEFTDEESGRRIRAAFTPDQIDGGPVNGVYILSTDVTAETQARSALAQTRKRELAAQFTSGMAHDFANLLTVILGLQSRMERLPLPDEARALATGIQAAARRGGVLLDRIASISGRPTLKPAPTDVGALLADLRLLATPTLPVQTRLEIVLPPQMPVLMLDAGGLQDALLNLVLNARDAMGPKGGTIRIALACLRDTWLEIRVEDDGPGFSPEALEKALDPFFTTKGSKGSGLGLSMVYDHATLAGGTVRLSNRPGGGASISVRLPFRPVAEGQAEGLPPLLVLLVEDDSDIREGVREMLRAQGHAVIEAASVDEALALAEVPGIGLILSDIQLGVAQGTVLAETLAERRHPAPVLLMSALPAGDPRRAAARVPVLSKPFDAAALATAIGAARA